MTVFDVLMAAAVLLAVVAVVLAGWVMFRVIDLDDRREVVDREFEAWRDEMRRSDLAPLPGRNRPAR
ncbi:MAG TPA: hypothetical protein VFU14_20290 [Acidimicrobiales bacterium]|nr:hypothetical protein [Acidimicrobiales bacterium]